MRRLFIPALFVAHATLVTAQTSRPAGVVGEYTPPRTWPERARVFDLLHQRIALSYDLDQRSLAAEVQTRLVVTAAPTDTIRLDASNLTIDAALDPRGKRLRFTADTAGVTVRLPRRAQVGDTVVFTLRYHGHPERGMYFVPRRRVMWTQGESIETRSWVPTYDAPNDKTTWEFLVTADTGVSVLSNGRLVEVTPVAGGTRQVWHWAQELPASTYLYSVVAGHFAVLEDQWRGVPVEYWVAPDTVVAGWRTFGETPSMLEIYSRVLAVNFPWAKYSESVIPDFTYGGMENVSATTQTDLALHPAGGEPESSGRGLNAHELAHQWFGDLTTTACWAHIWLNEGLTTYMESVQAEKSRGWETGQWSWWNQQQAAMGADEGGERPLVLGERPGQDPITLFFSGHVYPKGAQVAHQLRRLLGDSVFWAGMHRFLTDNAFKPVETSDYAVAMEKVSGRDLDWFFDQWAYGLGYPKLQVTRAWDGTSRTLNLTVEQTQKLDATHPVFRFPVTVRVVTRDTVVRREIMVSKPRESFALALPGEPVSFRFDEGGWLLGTVHTDQTPAELAALAMHDLEFAARNWALRQLDGDSSAVAREARRRIALNDESPWLRAEAVRQLGAESTSASVEIVRAALADPASAVRAQAIASLAHLDPTTAQAAAVELIRHDASFAVQAAALEVYDPATAPEGVALLIERTRPGTPLNPRLTAANGLLKAPTAESAAALAAMTDPAEPRSIRTGALDVLSRFPAHSAAVAVATRYLTDGDPLFAVTAVQTLAQIGGAEPGLEPEIKTRLTQALGKETRVTVRAAIHGAVGN